MISHLKTRILIAQLTLLLSIFSSQSHATNTEVDGYLNPVEDMRYYMEQLDRLPERLGPICWASYEVHKEGKHEHALDLIHGCADRGLVATMLMLSNMYETGILNSGEKPKVSTLWLKRAAETGDDRGQYYYGLALLRGYGTSKNEALGRQWIRLAARQGDPDALDLSSHWQ